MESSTRAAVAAFWRWWGEGGAAEVAAATSDGEPERIAGLLSDHVHRIAAGLAWETGAGTDSRHLLTVTAAGDADLRATARRWLIAAPDPDPTWAYADLRQPLPDPATGSLTLAGTTIGFAGVVIGARAVGNHLDVAVHHPAFASQSEDDRIQAAYLVLDALAGEELVECWIGEISAVTIAPLDAFPAVHLGAFVRGFARQRQDEHGSPQWVLLRGTGPDGPVMAVAQASLSGVLAPLLDTHVAVDLPYADRNPDDLPGPVALESLRAMEDHLTDRLGSDGRLVAAETSAGVRRLHFYVEADSVGAGVLAASVTSWDQGEVRTTSGYDPGWGEVAHLRS
ncbi:MAG: DUF695 domain-containing protein [Dermatophilaceae bacterium]